MAFIYTWLRLSANRQLPWYKNSNYQSKDIAHVQKAMAEAVAEKARPRGRARLLLFLLGGACG